jgi:hypothetical protein
LIAGEPLPVVSESDDGIKQYALGLCENAACHFWPDDPKVNDGDARLSGLALDKDHLIADATRYTRI